MCGVDILLIHATATGFCGRLLARAVVCSASDTAAPTRTERDSGKLLLLPLALVATRGADFLAACYPQRSVSRHHNGLVRWFRAQSCNRLSIIACSRAILVIQVSDLTGMR